MNREGCTVDADDLSCRTIVDIDLPAATVAVAQVHAKEHLAPVLSLKAPLPRRNGNDRVAVIEVVGKPAGKLELRELVLERRRGFSRLGKKIVVPHLLAELERRGGVIELGVRAIDGGHIGLGRSKLRHHIAGGVRIVPKRRVRALLLEALDVQAALVDVEIAFHLDETRAQSVERVLSYIRHSKVPSGSCRGSS